MTVRRVSSQVWAALGLTGILVVASVAVVGCHDPGNVESSRQLTALAVQPSAGSAFAPRGTLQFEAVGTFNQEPNQAPATVRWSSSAPTIATVDAAGLATCVAPGGPVTITAKDAGASGHVTGVGTLTCGLRQLLAMSVEPSVVRADRRSSVDFVVDGTFDNEPTTEVRVPAEWVSSDLSVATVDPSTGRATCLAAGGQVTVTAAAEGKDGTLIAAGQLICRGMQIGHCESAPSGNRHFWTGTCVSAQGGACFADPNVCEHQSAGGPEARLCGRVVDTSSRCIFYQ